MSTFTTNTTARPLFAPLSAYVSGLKTTVAQYRLYRKTISELSALTNAELADLGLYRCSIKSIAMETVYGR